MPAYGTRKNQGRLETIPGFLPAPGTITGRCVYADRCANVTDRCRAEAPPAIDLGGRISRCFYPERAPDLPRQVAVPARAAQPGPAAQTRTQAHEVPLLRTHHLSKTYRIAGRPLQAVHDVTLELWPGETLGLVGRIGQRQELARQAACSACPRRTRGAGCSSRGEALPASADDRSREQLKALQIVFQNPGSALNRSQTVRRLARALAAPDPARRAARARRVSRSSRNRCGSPRSISTRNPAASRAA